MLIDQIKNNFQTTARLLGDFIGNEQNFELLACAGDYIVKAFDSGHKVISCGNGGSMSDAMHFAEELSGRFRGDRKALPAFAVSDSSHITCTANDYGFEAVFSRFIEALGKPGDVLLAISTSGNSPNIVKACEAALEREMIVVGLTGKTGGAMAALCHVEMRIPYMEFSDRIQELHIQIIHSLIHYIELKMGLAGH